MVLDGSTAAVQEGCVKQRHGQWPHHNEANCESNAWLVRGPSTLNVERRCQVGFGLARDVQVQKEIYQNLRPLPRLRYLHSGVYSKLQA